MNNEQAEYRNFRQSVLDELQSQRSEGWQEDRPRYRRRDTPLSLGRAAITDFRNEMARRAALPTPDTVDDAKFVRRALRLPSTLPLALDTKATIQKWAFVFLPFATRVRRARRLLRETRTFEGRKLLFGLYVEGTLAWHGLHYDRSVDYALRWFDPVLTRDEFRQWEQSRLDLLRTARALGLRTVDEVRAAFKSSALRQRSDMVYVLVAEGVIQSVSELPWAETAAGSAPSYGRAEPEELLSLRGTVRALLRRRVGREQVAAILRFPLNQMAPPVLEGNMAAIERVGITDMAVVLEQVGPLLWHSPKSTWLYLLDVIGARTPAQLGQFRRLLDSHQQLSVDLAQELVASYGTLDELAKCQNVLVALDPERADVHSFVAHARRLIAPPHSMDASQLARCVAYLKGEAGLLPFLDVLGDHGYVDAASLIEFERCFRQMMPAALRMALNTLVLAGSDEALAERVDWVLQASKGGHFPALDYLVQTLGLRGLAPLRQIMPLAPLGVPFLRGLVQDRRFDSVKALSKWYYAAQGVTGLRSERPFDALDKLLFDDAFDRNYFGLLVSNQQAVLAIQRNCVAHELGPWPAFAAQAEKDTFSAKSRLVDERVRSELLPILMPLLQSTGGVILESLFDDYVQRQAFDLGSKLERLNPLLTELLAGRGPSDGTLTPMELDAIAVVYRAPPDFVQTHWHEVRGREADMQQLGLRPSYAMSWRVSRRRLRRPLDDAGLKALLKAASFSRRFSPDVYRDMFTACQELSPKQLWQNTNGASVETLSQHLGSLLALARTDDAVGRWIMEGFDTLFRMEQDSLDAYQRIGELVDLFNVALPDALDALATAVIEKLPEDEATHWATRMAPPIQELTGRTLLKEAVRRTRDKVLPVYLDWANRQFRLYDKDEDAARDAQTLHAVVSKHPTAYFSRQSVGLCTSSNVAMWRESRLLHLLVFDPRGKRLAGMAYLYVQRIPELDRERPSLVIRAINPTKDALAGHDTRSVVENFLNVAVQIAQDSGLSCVAFPALTGSHLMSNSSDVEADLKKRYVARAGHPGRPLREAPQLVRAGFFAYEHGSEPVDTLYVVWRSGEGREAAPARQDAELTVH